MSYCHNGYVMLSSLSSELNARVILSPKSFLTRCFSDLSLAGFKYLMSIFCACPCHFLFFLHNLELLHLFFGNRYKRIIYSESIYSKIIVVLKRCASEFRQEPVLILTDTEAASASHKYRTIPLASNIDKSLYSRRCNNLGWSKRIKRLVVQNLKMA